MPYGVLGRVLGTPVLLFILLLPLHAADTPPPRDDVPVAWKAEGIELPAPEVVTYHPGRLLRIKANSKGHVGWQVIVQPGPDGKPPELDWIPSDTEVSMPFPAGGSTVFVVGSVTVPGKDVPSVAVTTVTVGGPAPNPTPTPGPGPSPSPSPVPVAGKLHVTVVLDYDHLTPAQSALVSSATLKKALEADNDVLRQYPATSPVLTARKLSTFLARGGGPPAVLVQNEQGVVLTRGPDGKPAAVPLPADESGLLALLARIRKGV